MSQSEPFSATPSISVIKRARTSLLDRIAPQRFIFHHAPKCGGTSVGASLRLRYLLSQATVTPESSFRAFESFSGRTDREQMLIDVLDFREQMLLYWLYEDIRCVALHVRFSNAAYDRFHNTYKFITILREPVSRFISHYFWSYNKPNAHANIEEELHAFLDTDRARRLGATYVEFFSGLPKEADILAPEAAEAAVKNLRRFDVVGRLDDLTGFEQAIKGALGVRIKVGHHNKTPRPASRRKELVTPELRGRIVDLCAPDLSVWHAVT